MSYTVTIARTIAILAHRGQLDKSGNPYIDHPERVVRIIKTSTDWQTTTRPRNSDEYEATAWLHDVLEDSMLTMSDLKVCWIPDTVIAAVEALTHRKGESNEDYWARVKKNEIARRVKLADISDNMDPERLELLDDATIVRLTRKYSAARKALA